MLGFALWLSHDRFEVNKGASLYNVAFGSPLLSSGLGLLTASAVSRNGLLGRVRVPGARLVALLAFSLYLTHKQMAHLAQDFLPRLTEHRDARTLAIDAASCFLGASALYLGVEQPFVKLRIWLEGRDPAAVEKTMQVDPAL